MESAPSERARPERLAALLREGELAETAGDGASAGAAYARAAAEFPDFAAAWSYHGEHLRFWSNDSARAEAAFRRALAARTPDDAAQAFALRGLGELAHARGDAAAAVECFERSLAVCPLADTHRSLSALYATEQKDFAKAAAHAEAAVALDPRDSIALLQLAVQAERAGTRDRAEAAFRDAIGSAGCDAQGRSAHAVHCCVLYNGACYHAVRGDAASALAMLEAFFRHPNHRHITRGEIAADPDFDRVRAEPGFIALLDAHLPE